MERARLAATTQEEGSPSQRLRSPLRPAQPAWEPAASMVDPSRSSCYCCRWNESSVSDAAQQPMCANSNTVTVCVGAVMSMLARQQYFMLVQERPGAGGGQGGHSQPLPPDENLLSLAGVAWHAGSCFSAAFDASTRLGTFQ
jgi:hypothetical protein